MLKCGNGKQSIPTFLIRMKKGNRQNAWIRKLILQICSIYGDGYAFLGESFCEDEFGMKRSEKGTKGVDGYIGKYAIQVKFKWVTEENISSRYITVKSDAEFDILIICVNSGDDEVRLFGAWEKWQVEEARTNKLHDRVMLKDLDKLDRLQIKKI